MKTFLEDRQDASIHRAMQMLSEVNPDAPYILCYVGKSGDRSAQILQATNGTDVEVARSLIDCLREIGIAMGYTVNDMRVKFKTDDDEEPKAYTDAEAGYVLLAAAALEAKDCESYKEEV